MKLTDLANKGDDDAKYIINNYDLFLPEWYELDVEIEMLFGKGIVKRVFTDTEHIKVTHGDTIDIDIDDTISYKTSFNMLILFTNGKIMEIINPQLIELSL